MFKVGDLVRMKSGSPKMIVTDVVVPGVGHGFDSVTVTWCAYGTSVVHTHTGPSIIFVLCRD